tara:strand:+ start:82 stop:1008 length:927 start_codon:yes stop_codon:yes gene_type:complete
MNILFMGTPEFAVPTLDLLNKNYNLIGVFTQPPRPSGRGMKEIKSSIQQYSEKNKLNFHTPNNLKSDETFRILKNINPDLIIVVAYGLLIPDIILKIPPYGCINGHASLLPKWRGAAPIQRAIEAGDKKTGCTSMLMEKGLDTGPIILKKEIIIKHEDDVIDLFKSLSVITAECLDETIQKLISREFKQIPQNNLDASYAHKLSKEEGLINWNNNSFDIYNKMRAFKIFPGTYFNYKNDKINIIDGYPVNKKHNENPGKILTTSGNIQIACGKNTIFQINSLKKSGKKSMSAKEFLNGNNLNVGEVID